MAKIKLPPEVLEQFRKQGRIGGKTAAANMTGTERVKRSKKAHMAMTPEQRCERALKAVRARERNRRVAKQKRK
jgi:hypothetical protein